MYHTYIKKCIAYIKNCHINETIITYIKNVSHTLNNVSHTGNNQIHETMYSETLNNEYIIRIHQMSYSSLSDNGMLQIFSFLIK